MKILRKIVRLVVKSNFAFFSFIWCWLSLSLPWQLQGCPNVCELNVRLFVFCLFTIVNKFKVVFCFLIVALKVNAVMHLTDVVNWWRTNEPCLHEILVRRWSHERINRNQSIDCTTISHEAQTIRIACQTRHAASSLSTSWRILFGWAGCVVHENNLECGIIWQSNNVLNVLNIYL